PFTLASYCIGTGKNIDATRGFAAAKAGTWKSLLDCLASATIHFLESLAREGADIYQLFDSWAGMLEKDEYDRWAQPYHARICAEVSQIPRILFVKECPHLDLMANSGAEVISLGRSHDLAAARREYPELVFQGNVDEHLLRAGSPEEVTEATI